MPRTYESDYTEEEWAEMGEQFADPGGDSPLAPVSAGNPRDQACPSCGLPDMLTPKDVAKGYQCEQCADAAERGA